jgi:uncharacterized RmlC-like cupin family protein
MTTRRLVCAVVLATATAVSADPAGVELRLTPDEIRAMPSISAGAGTSGLSGIRTTVLFGDPTRAGPYVIALAVPPNTTIAAHRHRDFRTSVIVSGAWHFGYGDVHAESALKLLRPGSFYTEPANVMHFARTGSEGALLYVTGSGPTDTVYSGK